MVAGGEGDGADDHGDADRGDDDLAADDLADADRGGDDLPGAPATPRTRAKSAALWGVVGGIAFLVAAQGYLLLDGDLPVGYGGLFALAGVLAVAVAGVAYRIEHRIGAKRRT